MKIDTGNAARNAPVLITGARAPVALHLARLLTAAGHPVTLVDHLRYPLAAASNTAKDYHRIPPFSDDPGAAQAALARIISSRGIQHVIPTCEEVLHLAAMWARSDMGAALCAPSLDQLTTVHNKFTFIDLCQTIGLDVPRTHLLTSLSDITAQEATAQTQVFKPVWSRFGSKVLIRPKRSHLRRITPTPSAPWVAQSYLTGTELCVYAVAQQGRITALTAYRGIVRAGPGAAVCFAPVKADIVRPFVQRFVSATGWTGQISFDLMQTDSGQILPLECNPRATSGLHFFTNGAEFAPALLGDAPEVTPDVTMPQAVRLALWLYGPPMMLRHSQRRAFLDALRGAGDVINWPADPIGLWPQLRSVAEFATIAARHRISLEAASTYGIEWNGGDQISIS